MSTLFSTDHQWITADDAKAAIVGITVHAQDALGDIVFVELPTIGRSLQKGEVAGVVESVKAAADVFAPVGGEVVEVNEALRTDPSLANTDPLASGWFFKMRLADPDELESLLDADAYDALVKNT